MTRTMRAIVISAAGGPEGLRVQDVETPELQQDSLLVDVRAAGVNFLDLLQCSGAYPVTFPFIPGTEGVGIVRATGSRVTEFAVGDRVAWAMVGRSYAELVVVPVAGAVSVPDGLTDEQALALAQGLTAHYLATSAYPAADGDTVLVHAAAGGVGFLLTQILTLRGARVIATVSTANKSAAAKDAGASHVLVTTELESDVAAEVRRLTAGEGVAAVYDGVGEATFDASLGSLRRRGYLILYGGASGAVTSVDPARLLTAGSVYLTRPGLTDYTATRDELVRRANELYSWIADGRLIVRVGGRYALDEAGRAHADLSARRTTGKLVLAVGDGSGD